MMRHVLYLVSLLLREAESFGWKLDEARQEEGDESRMETKMKIVTKVRKHVCMITAGWKRWILRYDKVEDVMNANPVEVSFKKRN
jgi:hypothetical protein